MRCSKEQEELVLNNMGLVHSLVRKLYILDNYDDMVSIGTIGLIKASKSFDSSKGVKFATYAGKCINNELLMYFRKEKHHLNNVSLEEPIANDVAGNEITRSDTISGAEDLENDFIKRETFERFMNIILNLLKQKERLLMLYELAGANQSLIAKTLKFSQSYVSRMEKKLNKKVMLLMSSAKKFKEVFSMAFSEDQYKISFMSKDIEQFNKIFATLLQKLTGAESLPDFKVNCNKERIVIQVPAHPESFSFIAQIIQEIDEFSMSFVSNKADIAVEEREDNIEEKIETFEPEDEANISKTVEENETALLIHGTVETVEDEVNENSKYKSSALTKESTVIEEDTNSSVETSNGVGQVRNYFLSLDSFTVKELIQHFPELSKNTIRNAVYLAKKKGLIKSTQKGKYNVNKN